jgi:hypothetical protein
VISFVGSESISRVAANGRAVRSDLSTVMIMTTKMDQHFADLAAILPPTHDRDADDFSDLRDKTVRQHIGAAASQPLGHAAVMKEIRARMDEAQNRFDDFTSRMATGPAEERMRKDELERAAQRKRAYSEMLDVVKRACGAACSPDNPNDQPDPRFP